MISDEQIAELYDDYLEFTGNQAVKYPAAAVASIMLAQSLAIYRAIMTEDDYQALLVRIGDDKIPTPSLITKKHTLQ